MGIFFLVVINFLAILWNKFLINTILCNIQFAFDEVALRKVNFVFQEDVDEKYFNLVTFALHTQGVCEINRKYVSRLLYVGIYYFFFI